MTVALYVRLCLTFYRRQGLPFEVAWARTLQSLPRIDGDELSELERQEWSRQLRATKPWWRAAYERAPKPPRPPDSYAPGQAPALEPAAA